jgi:hypothetical protein
VTTTNNPHDDLLSAEPAVPTEIRIGYARYSGMRHVRWRGCLNAAGERPLSVLCRLHGVSH